jgi:alcohol dehydrogenase
MNAIRVENNKLQLVDVPLARREGEALVRMTMAGICSTDIEITRGYAGFSGTLGHEFVGVVEESPNKAQIGRRVVGEINTGCGHCDLCRDHDPRHCRNRMVLGIRGRDGAFAEYLNLPTQNLLLVPDSVSDRQAVFTEPLAAACAILEQVEITAGRRVAVIGDGKLGQLISRLMTTTGCDLTLIGKHAAKLELAARAGIKFMRLGEQNEREPLDTPERSIEKSLGVDLAMYFDFVIEASGSANGLRLALDLVRPRGAVILKSTFHGEAPLNTSKIVVNEIRVIGSRCGRFENALRLLEDGKVDVEPLISREYKLVDGVAAIAEAQRPGILKVLLTN